MEEIQINRAVKAVILSTIILLMQDSSKQVVPKIPQKSD